MEVVISAKVQATATEMVEIDTRGNKEMGLKTAMVMDKGQKQVSGTEPRISSWEIWRVMVMGVA